MTQTIEDLRGRIETAENLHSVVRTMKGLAAVNIRQYERAVAALQDYVRTIELGFQILLRTGGQEVRLHVGARQEGGRVAAVIIGSDQGMVGQFNQRIARYALDTLDREGVGREQRIVLSLGARLTGRLDMDGHAVTDAFPLPRSIEGITGRVEDIITRLQEHRERDEVNRIVLFHNRPRRAAAYDEAAVRVFPIDPGWLDEIRRREWPTRQLPSVPMAPPELLGQLVREYFFVMLYRGLAESLAAENAARLASMQSAQSNIEDRLTEFRQAYHQRRQTTITEELLDVMAGFEAMQG